METILTLIVLGMLFQGLLAVLNSVLSMAKVDETVNSLPIVGSNLNLIYAYLLVLATDINAGSGISFGASIELLSLGRFGADVATAIVILAFIPVKDAVISAIGKGFSRG